MASQTLVQFPIFAPSKPSHHRPATATKVRFSRWNNANAEKFIRHERTQKDIEDQIRFQRRFDSAHNIASYNYNPAPPTPTFKSTGTPSSPSQPSIPGKKSKYSRNPRNPKPLHPAFKPILRTRKIPIKSINGIENEEDASNEAQEKSVANVKIDDKGVSYEFPDAPFVYQYSYTETPKMKPLGLREPLVAPFEPATMGRPWTGRKPLPPSKKKRPEFDSFQLPPPHKKGVKPVQAPGPYLSGTGPKYVRSREEILGEPLTKDEVKVLIESCRKATRQLNIGRDGLTHNMLDNIHAHWKRRRVCKIKCKGVCTVDMENVQEQLEEKTGGKVIFGRGGVIYLFRGRNYNYKTRPQFPLMLWKPVTPVYPRLIKRVPEGLTLEKASEMRKKGRNLTPICKLAKNGVYCDLVKNVREAFEACELVRINCQGVNGSDYRKIGAKLKDLVPCVLISFEHEHILMWRGQDWKSSLPELKSDAEEMQESESDTARSLTASSSSVSKALVSCTSDKPNTSTCSSHGQDVESEGSREHRKEDAADPMTPFPSESLSSAQDICENERPSSHASCVVDSEALVDINDINKELDGSKFYHNDTSNMSQGSETRPEIIGDNGNHSELPPVVPLTFNKLQEASENTICISELPSPISPSTEEVLLLQKQAVESGSAVVLDETSFDADIVFEKAVALAKSAPPGPVFRHRPKKLLTQGCDNKKGDDLEVRESVTSSEKENEVSIPSRRGNKKSSRSRSMEDIKEEYLNVVPQGSLRVDELAKLLS